MHLFSLLQMPCTICMYTHPSALIFFAVTTMVFQQASKLISYQKKFAAHLKQSRNKIPAGRKTYLDESVTPTRPATPEQRLP